MSETEILVELRQITVQKEGWTDSIERVGGFLSHVSLKVQAKALWLLGEMGLLHPKMVGHYVEAIADFMSADESLLRERALNALGRTGRGKHALIEPYLPQMRQLASDSEPSVRLAFIWACENIATNAPELFVRDMPLFASLLGDENDRVRIEAPEIFRVLGKRKSEYVTPYLAKLQELSESDPERVVRIHAAGAVRAARKGVIDHAADK